MSSAKFTPGPWQATTHAETEFDWHPIRANGLGLPIANVRRMAETPLEDVEGYANARLIAAAPEMYEALEEAERCMPGDPAAQEIKARCRAALSKARGEA